MTEKKPSKSPIGVVHGRFQLLHLGHMKYILTAKAACDFLYIGVTSPKGPLSEEEAARYSARPEDNPFTFGERKLMLEAALEEAGITESEYQIVPVPSDYQDIEKSVPKDATFFLTIYDDLGHEKERTLKAQGFKVEVLMNLTKEERGVSGGEIRKMLEEGGQWEEHVPHAVAHYLKEHDLVKRLL